MAKKKTKACCTLIIQLRREPPENTFVCLPGVSCHIKAAKLQGGGRKQLAACAKGASLIQHRQTFSGVVSTPTFKRSLHRTSTSIQTTTIYGKFVWSFQIEISTAMAQTHRTVRSLPILLPLLSYNCRAAAIPPRTPFHPLSH